MFTAQIHKVTLVTKLLPSKAGFHIHCKLPVYCLQLLPWPAEGGYIRYYGNIIHQYYSNSAGATGKVGRGSTFSSSSIAGRMETNRQNNTHTNAGNIQLEGNKGDVYA